MRAVNKGYTQMRDVKVSKNTLLSKVITNREKHIAAYDEAIAGYKEAALLAIEDAVGKLRRSIDDLKLGEVITLAAVRFSLPVPENHEKDYDQVIAMLEMSVDDVLTIKSDEFACFVMDDWDWKEVFAATNKSYSK